MSWESAANISFADSPTSEQIDASQDFVSEHSDELIRCYAPEFASQRPTVCRFIAQLFFLLEKPDWDETKTAKESKHAVGKVADLLAREDFFTSVFDHALSEGDQSLLELVHSALFSEIVFDSDLTRLWFEKKRKFESKFVDFSSIVRASITIVSTQFLDVRQDWAQSNPSAALLTGIQTEITEGDDLTIKLVWNFALYCMAQCYYASEQGNDAHGIESIMQSLQARAGVHWSEVSRDQLQMSLPGLDGLIKALELCELHKLEFLDGQLLAQTVADVVSGLFVISNPTETLCTASAMAVSPWPALQTVHWVHEASSALTKAKNPASIASLVSLAQTMDTPKRYEYLREMTTYVSVVDVSCLDIADHSHELGGLDDSLLGQDVRTTKVVSALPPRPSDGQGTLEISVGTRGTLLAYNGSDCLVMWYFTYNGWSLLGRISENADLTEGDNWSPLTIEIVKLITMTISTGVQTVLSAGLARGDIVDLIAHRSESWIHGGKTSLCSLAFAFFVEVAHLDPARVWVLMASMDWTSDNDVLLGAKRLFLVLWPSFDAQKTLHQRAARKLAVLCAEHYLSNEPFDASISQVFEHLLPVDPDLREDLLGTSDLRGTSLTPLLTNLDKADTLKFCTFCVKYANSQERNSLSYLEKQLFLKSRDLAECFAHEQSMRLPILRLWTASMSYPEAPPLLAFLEDKQAESLKQDFVSSLKNRSEPVESIDTLALFMISARRQESLIDLLWEPLKPLFESRVQSIENPAILSNLIRVFINLKGNVKKETLQFLQEKVKAEADSNNLAELDVKQTILELFSKQLRSDKGVLLSFIDEITSLIPQLTKIDGIRPSSHSRLFRNLRNKWPSITVADNPRADTNDADTTANLDLDIKKWDAKLEDDPVWQSSYRQEMLEAINNKHLIEAQSKVVIEMCIFIQTVAHVVPETKRHSIEWSTKLLQQNSLLLPLNLQLAENKRTETALVSLSLHNEASISLLDLIYHQLTDITSAPSAGLPSLKSRLVMLMQMAAILLSHFKENKNTKFSSILLGLSDVVVIKQLQIFGSSEDTLRLHLILLRHCLRLLNDPVAPRSLVQSMTESGSDRVILSSLMTTSIDEPTKGKLLLLYIQEWLPTDIMTDNFVRNGLMNTLIEAPLGRKIQEGDVIAGQKPLLHSFWREGVLPVVLRSLKQLGARIAQESWLFVSIYSAQILTCQDQWKAGQISLGSIEETLLLYALLKQLNELDSNQNDKIDVGFDEEELVKIIDVLLSHKKYLVARTSKRDDLETVISALRDLKRVIA